MQENAKKCVVWGAGYYGQVYFNKLTKHLNYDVLAYIDSNSSLQGTFVNNKEVMSPDILRSLEPNIDVIVCLEKYEKIIENLSKGEHARDDYYLMLDGFLYRYSSKAKMVPVHLNQRPYKKTERNRFSILYVQNTACIRTHKFAYMMRNLGADVCYLYTICDNLSNSEYLSIYSGVYTVTSFSDLVNFINDSDFNIVHSSNEPDYITNLLLGTNKKIVHDTHDMMSVRDRLHTDILTIEYNANTMSAGCLYVNEMYRKLAIEKFSIAKEKTFAIENFPLESLAPDMYLPKLSNNDGELHCVYEGGISDNVESTRYFEDMWEKITDRKIHVHFYSDQKQDYCIRLSNKCDYLHYEGNFTSKQLSTEMTKYDCGLVLFNLDGSQIENDKLASVLKIYEYLNAGIPIAVNNISHFIRFVEKYSVGAFLDLDGNVKEQLVNIAANKISKTFLRDNNMTLDANAESLLAFYKSL